MKWSVFAAVLGALALGGFARALPTLEIVALGLEDDEHTRDFDGLREGLLDRATESGFAVGYSDRFIEDRRAGRSAWLWDGIESTRVGFWDSVHTRVSDGLQSSFVRHLAESGVAAGTSQRLGVTTVGRSAWVYDGGTTRVGLHDAAHTRATGAQYSEVEFLTGSGFAAGFSERYDGHLETGNSVWLWDGAQTRRMGFADENHSRLSDGSQSSHVVDLTESGFAVGTSVRYAGSTSAGSSAWLHDGAETLRIGFFDAAHTRPSDSYQASFVDSVNDAGVVAGTSSRFAGELDVGTAAWRHSGGETTRLGYTDGQHTRATDGHQFSQIRHLTGSGLVVGTSRRYDGESNVGVSLWLSDGATIAPLGLTDAAHTRADGGAFHGLAHITESGFAAGTSGRFAADAHLGISAWRFDGADTVRVGLTDEEHTRSVNGSQESAVVALTESGMLVGTSDRFVSSGFAGTSVWFSDGQTTTRVGLFDAAHTRADGFQESEVDVLTESGRVIGTSVRFDGANDSGQSVWFFDGNETIRLGLFDADHTRSTDGLQDSDRGFLTESGFVSGATQRFAGPNFAGQTGWIFDADAEELSPIVLSVRSDGRVFSGVGQLRESGLALGNYSRFAEDDTTLGGSLFIWTPEEGASDLSELIVDFSDRGWNHLTRLLRANGLEIFGVGEREPGGLVPFAIAPVPVPEPGAIASLAAGGLVLTLTARRRRSLGGRGAA